MNQTRNRLCSRDHCSFARMQQRHWESLYDGWWIGCICKSHWDADRLSSSQSVVIRGYPQLEVLSQRISRSKDCEPWQPSWVGLNSTKYWLTLSHSGRVCIHHKVYNCNRRSLSKGKLQGTWGCQRLGLDCASNTRIQNSKCECFCCSSNSSIILKLCLNCHCPNSDISEIIRLHWKSPVWCVKVGCWGNNGNESLRSCFDNRINPRSTQIRNCCR